ncbi:recombinase [Elizabethkingia anophelis]|nr:recombinase [Elizabethkingia anophelis]
MIESSFGINFFLKSPKKGHSGHERFVYLRVTVDGIPKETSTKCKWDSKRWDQKAERATGSKEDARGLNLHLDSLKGMITGYRTQLINTNQPITALAIIRFVKGDTVAKNKLLDEFLEHNNEMKELVEKKQYAIGTYKKFKTSFDHVSSFVKLKYRKNDLEFRELNYEFIKDYDHYLRTIRGCNNNSTNKYIGNLKKIVLRGVAKDYIPKDPFKLFKGHRVIVDKEPLTKRELWRLQNKKIESERLAVVRDIFVFQCYTGLAYIDVYKLQVIDIKEGNDGQTWVMIRRQKSKSKSHVPLLPQALEILKRYREHPLCKSRGSALPVKSNQKMNEYLKEIAALCEITIELSTHTARRTFASTVTLNNGVPINVVKEILGHHSVRQTEHYTITAQETIGREMKVLEKKLSGNNETKNNDEVFLLIGNLQQELDIIKNAQQNPNSNWFKDKVSQFEQGLSLLKNYMNENSNSNAIC